MKKTGNYRVCAGGFYVALRATSSPINGKMDGTSEKALGNSHKCMQRHLDSLVNDLTGGALDFFEKNVLPTFLQALEDGKEHLPHYGDLKEPASMEQIKEPVSPEEVEENVNTNATGENPQRSKL